MSRIPPRPLLPHPTDPNALLVPLTRGKFAVIDAADRRLVEGVCWHARRSPRKAETSQLAHAAEITRTVRGRLGLSQAQFARLLGVGQTAIWKWENGRFLPKPPHMRQLLELLGSTDPDGDFGQGIEAVNVRSFSDLDIDQHNAGRPGLRELGGATMHFFCVVLLDKDTDPSDFEGIVSERMAPYSEELDVDPYPLPMREREIPVMIDHYGTSDLQELVAHMPDWNGDQGAIIDGKLHRITTRNPKRAWGWYEFGGRWEDDIPGGWCQVMDLPPGFFCHALLLPDGDLHEEIAFDAYADLMDWGKSPTAEEIRAFHAEKRREWDAKRSELLSSFPRHIAVTVDYHR